MEASAPKRRKTSPTTNVPGGSGPNSSASSDGSLRRSARRQQSSDLNASEERTRPNAAPAASELGSPTSDNGYVSDLLEAQLEGQSETGRGHDEEREGANNTTRLVSAGTNLPPKSPVRRAGGGLASKPRRTPNKPSPRPLPPPSAEEEELINPFRARRGLRRSPPPGVLPRVEPQEPELPPTPTQKGISDPSSINTSPIGIHNTPSKRPRRSRVLAEKMKSSPLKQPPLRPPEPGKENMEGTLLFKDAKIPPKDDSKPRKRRRKSHPARNVEEADPLADKKALRETLAAEVAQLKADLEIASRENSRLFQLQQTRKPLDIVGPEDEGRLLDVLRRHALPPEKEEPPDPTQEWLEAALNPISFLPFGPAHPTLPPLFGSHVEEAKRDSPPPISHYPIPMAAEEELPYLQVFTPLTFTSTVTTAPREGQEEEPADRLPLMQRHLISVASSAPPGLFSAKIDMTVSTKTFAIASLSVPRLDPAAVTELGPFVEKITRQNGGGGNSALVRNVSIMTWAMAEWVRLATRRARFWCAVERDLGTPAGVTACAKAMRKGNGGAVRKRGPGRRPVDDGENEDEDEDEDGGREKEKEKEPRFSRAELLPQLGRTSLDLELSGVEAGGSVDDVPTARVQWRIEFDWTGEARSKIGLLVGAPAKWHGHDEKKSLAGIPEVFDKLVRESKDPMEALRTVVALVVGDGRT
ncbi:hypothetical protein F4775DRAFT_543300 [Biscogniauxia sp. FL1348]|nr:hypothetical protein F4775DRAFT_543300 [Biscogniauxia sp. FL1348]